MANWRWCLKSRAGIYCRCPFGLRAAVSYKIRGKDEDVWKPMLYAFAIQAKKENKIKLLTLQKSDLARLEFR